MRQTHVARWIGLVLLVALALSSGLHAAGTVTVARELVTMNGRAVEKITVNWTSHTDGTVTANAFAVKGWLFQASITPGSGGTQPTTLYDLAIKTALGIDVLTIDGSSSGANLSNSGSLLLRFPAPVLLESGSTLDAQVSNAGSAKTGTIVFYIEQ